MIAFFSNVVAFFLFFFFILDIAKSAVSLSVQGLFFNINVNGVKMHVQHSWRKKNLYLKGFECNLMEWKPQYLF